MHRSEHKVLQGVAPGGASRRPAPAALKGPRYGAAQHRHQFVLGEAQACLHGLVHITRAGSSLNLLSQHNLPLLFTNTPTLVAGSQADSLLAPGNLDGFGVGVICMLCGCCPELRILLATAGCFGFPRMHAVCLLPALLVLCKAEGMCCWPGRGKREGRLQKDHADLQAVRSMHGP